ncbi:MAG TPA: hypothetical protein VK939_13400 [Longimicrobiales bacterium]|nr:hypothetical protein [Longimicrobiales bacterium]
MAELLAAGATGALWLAAFGLLVRFARRWFGDQTGPALLAAYPVFFALQVLSARLAGAAGMLTTSAFLFLYVAAVLVGSVLWLRGRRVRAPVPTTADPDISLVRRLVLYTAAAVLAALLVFALVSPVHVWDVLAYHMPMVASYIQNGSLDAWPTQDLRHVFRVNAGELQLLHIALLGRSDTLVELPNLLGLVVVLVGTFELARLEYGRTALPYVAVALVLTAPQILVGAATAKNDLVFTAVLIASFYWMVRAGSDAVHAGSGTTRTGVPVALAALSTAVAAATKVMGLNVLGAVGLLALVMSARRRLPFRAVLLFGTLAVGALLALAGSVYWKNFSRSAVPVGVAPGEVSYTFGLKNLVAAAQFYLWDLPVKRLITPQVFEHDFLHYGYLFPLLLVLGTLAAVRQLRARRFVLSSLALGGTALILSVIALRLPIQWDQRFMIWMVPALAILALSHARRWDARAHVAVTAAACAITLVQLALVLTNETGALFGRSAQHLVATGVPARYIDVPNARYPEMGAGFARLDRSAAAHDSVLYAGSDDSWMYPAWGARFARHVKGVEDARQAAAQVASRRFRFVVLEDAAAPDIQRAVARSTSAAGYAILERARGRTIFVRDVTAFPSAAPGPASPVDEEE